MFSIQNISDEPFAVAGCPLLQPGDTAEVSAEVYRMVQFNPSIKILSSDLKGVEPEEKTNTKKATAVKGVE